MASTNLAGSLPPRHEAQPPMRFPLAFIKDFREFTVSRDHADALSVERHRAAQGLDDAEMAHGPFPCVDAACGQERCVAYQERVLATFPRGLVPCTTCGLVICPKARLDCNSGCAA